MKIAEQYNNWMARLRMMPSVGEVNHRVQPRYSHIEHYYDFDNKIPVSHTDHYYIHKMLYQRDKTDAALNAWYASWSFNVGRITLPKQEVKVLLKLRNEWTMRRLKDPAVIEALRISGAASPKIPHTKEHKEWLSKNYSGKLNPMADVLPWHNPASQQAHSIEIWLRLPEFYAFYEARKHRKTGWGYRAASRFFGYKRTSLYSAINWVRENGDPNQNKDWLDYKQATITSLQQGH